MKIQIEDNVCQRYIETFNPKLKTLSGDEQNALARKALIAIIKDSSYVADNNKGILLYHKKLDAKLIIRHKVLKIIYPEKHNTRKQNKRAENAKN